MCNIVFQIFVDLKMVQFKHLVVIFMLMNFIFSIESRANVNYPEVIQKPSNTNSNQRGVQTDDQEIRMSSVTSLEALLLEAIRVGGSDICLSPFARRVMLGTWRNSIPDREEMRDNHKLRQTCYQALLKDNTGTTTAAPVFIPMSRMIPKLEHPSRMLNSSIDEDLTFSLLPHAAKVDPVVIPRTFRQGPSPTLPPPRKDSSADPEVLQKANDIIKDKSADCKPREISIEIPREPNITYLPACAMVKRCGGCCKHESLHCVPVPEDITIMKKKVVAVNNKGVRLDIKHISIEKHNKCKCECKVKESDCNPLQFYDKKNCRCMCKQTGSSKPGRQNTCKQPLYWDERSCKCRCPVQTIVECSTGSFFSSDQCRCVTANEIIQDENTKRM